MTWAYCLSVNAGDSWPSRSLITLTGTPAFSASVACVCRRSWSRIRRRLVLLDQPLERLAERVRVDRLAVLLRDDEILVLVVGAPLRPLLVLALLVRSELRDRLGVEVDDAGAVALRRRVDDVVADRDERLANREPSPVEVEVLPAQPEDLAAAHAGHGR